MVVATKGINIARDLWKAFLDKQINRFKWYIRGKGSGITLTNNEIKDIMKVVNCLETRGIFKRTYQRNY